MAQTDKPTNPEPAQNKGLEGEGSALLRAALGHPKASPEVKTASAEPKPAEAKPASLEVKPHSTTTPGLLTASTRIMTADAIAPKAAQNLLARHEKKEDVTALSVGTAFAGGAGHEIKSMGVGMVSALDGRDGSLEAQRRNYELGLGRTNSNGALLGLVRNVGTFVSNLDKLPGTLMTQGKETVRSYSEGNANDKARILGQGTAIIGSLFVPVGGSTKLATEARATSELANGARAIEAARAATVDYRALSTATRVEEAALAGTVTRVPSAEAMRAATLRAAETPGLATTIKVAETPGLGAVVPKAERVAGTSLPTAFENGSLLRRSTTAGETSVGHVVETTVPLKAPAFEPNGVAKVKVHVGEQPVVIEPKNVAPGKVHVGEQPVVIEPTTVAPTKVHVGEQPVVIEPRNVAPGKVHVGEQPVVIEPRNVAPGKVHVGEQPVVIEPTTVAPTKVHVPEQAGPATAKIHVPEHPAGLEPTVHQPVHQPLKLPAQGETSVAGGFVEPKAVTPNEVVHQPKVVADPRTALEGTAVEGKVVTPGKVEHELPVVTGPRTSVEGTAVEDRAIVSEPVRLPERTGTASHIENPIESNAGQISPRSEVNPHKTPATEGAIKIEAPGSSHQVKPANEANLAELPKPEIEPSVRVEKPITHVEPPAKAAVPEKLDVQGGAVVETPITGQIKPAEIVPAAVTPEAEALRSTTSHVVSETRELSSGSNASRGGNSGFVSVEQSPVNTLSGKLARDIESNISALPVSERHIAAEISQKLKTLETSPTLLESSQAARQVLTDLAKPEYKAFFERHPQYGSTLREVEQAAVPVFRAETELQTAALGLERSQAVSRATETTTNLVKSADDLATRLPEMPNAARVKQELSEFSAEAGTIKAGQDNSLVYRSLDTRIQTIEAQGARDVAAELRRSLSESERAQLGARRALELDQDLAAGAMVKPQATVVAARNELSTQSGNLARSLENDLTLPVAEQKVAADIAAKLKTVETNPSVIADLSKGEYKAFFDNHPQYARSLSEVEQAAAPVLRAEREVVAVSRATESTAALSRSADELVKGLPEMPNAVRVKQELSEFSAEAKTIKLGQDNTTVYRSLETRIQTLESQGAREQATVLRQSLEDSQRAQLAAKPVVALEPEAVITVNPVAKLSSRVSEVSTTSGQLGRLIEADLPAIPRAERVVARDVSEKLLSIDAPTLSVTERAQKVQKVIEDLSRPEYSRFFAEHPQYAKAFSEIRNAGTEMNLVRSQVEAAAVGIERVQASTRFVDNAGSFSREADTLASRVAEGKIEVPATSRVTVQNELKAISNEVGTLAQGARSDVVATNVQRRIAAIEEAGAPEVAAQLRNGFNKVEESEQALARIRRLDNASVTIQSEGAQIARNAQKLADELRPVAEVKPSIGRNLPPEAQAARHFEQLAEDARALPAAADPAASISSMRNASAKIEELGGVKLLNPEQARLYEEIQKSLRAADSAAIESRGLAASETALVRSSDQVGTVIQSAAKTLPENSAGAQALRQAQEANAELRAARTLEERAVAARKLNQELANPELEKALAGTRGGSEYSARLASENAKIQEAVELSRVERGAARVERVSEPAISSVRKLEEAVDTAQGSSRANNLRTLTDDYERTVRELKGSGVGAESLEKRFAAVETEAQRAGVSQEAISAARREHEALRKSYSEYREIKREAVERNLTIVEQNFKDIAAATSTAAQREIIRNTYDKLELLRYIDGNKSAVSHLEVAQNRLLQAANDIEVATYRSNLIKLAGAGDKAAQEKLFVSGLVTDGFKTTSLSPEAGFFSTRAFLLGRGEGSIMRNISASDPFFVNNTNRYVPWLIGSVKYGTLGYFAGSEIKSLSDRIDAQVQAAQSDIRQPLEPGKAAEQTTEQSAEQPAMQPAAKPVEMQRPASGPLTREAARRDSDSSVVTFSPAVQTVARSAFSTANTSRVLPEQPATQQAKWIMPNVFANDPDLARELTLVSTYGTPFMPGLKSGESTSIEAPTPVIARARTLSFNTTGGDRSLDGKLIKPASSQFPIRSALSLASPFSLSNNQQTGRQGSAKLTTLGGTAVTNVTTSRTATSDVAHLASLASASDAEEGGQPTVMAKIEDTTGIHEHGGSTHTASQNLSQGEEDDEDEHGAPSRVPPLPVSPTVVAASPTLTDPSQTQDEKHPLPGPPRKRGSKDTVSA